MRGFTSGLESFETDIEKNIDKPEIDSETMDKFDNIFSDDFDLDNLDNNENAEKGNLTSEQKSLIKDETGWSDNIVDHIDTEKQYDDVYKNADLHEGEINGRDCLLKDIDLDYVDEKTGLTNRERMQKGRSPYDSKTGEKIELHHMGQDFDSPFAELTENSEHGDGNHKT
ncbi:MAG: HNH/ENDO VII family nuclease, partial [Eubacterium sp.]|nr:HNH/ENDO VII family nuclease [Eubacterium sp.]